MRRPSPWHLVLFPMALVFALPLLWLIVSSFMTNAQINRFPPTIGPVARPPTIVRRYGSSGSCGTGPVAPVRNPSRADSHVNSVRSG